MKENGKMSVVLPAYNEEQMLEKAALVISKLLEDANIPYELVFVDDGSKDNTWNLIEKVAKENENIKGIHFSRNFGKESAILAGLANADGDCVVVMDCDLQHPAELVVDMYELWQQGYEIVEGVKRSRGKESFVHKTCVGLFYKIISRAVKIDMTRASDFKLMDRKAVDSLLSMPEKNSFFRALSSWIGYKTKAIEFDVREREGGESKWSTKALIKYAVTNIVAFSTAPMQIVTVAGVLVFIMGVVVGIQTLVNFATGKAVEGFTTVILLLLIIGSIIMISLGIIGYYIAKIYEEVKGRPKYLISKIVGDKK